MKTLWNDWEPIIAKVRRGSKSANRGSLQAAIGYCMDMAAANQIAPPNAVILSADNDITLQWGRDGAFIRRLTFTRNGIVERSFETPNTAAVSEGTDVT